MKQLAGHPGVLHVPAVFKEDEERAIMQGRIQGVALGTLNEYRTHFGLKAGLV